MANERREEFVKRVAESRSEEYLSPPIEIAKSQTNVELAKALNDDEDATAADLSVPVSSRPSLPQATTTASVKDEKTRHEQHKNLLKNAYRSRLSAILDPIAYLREKHNFELKVVLCGLMRFL